MVFSSSFFVHTDRGSGVKSPSMVGSYLGPSRLGELVWRGVDPDGGSLSGAGLYRP